MIVVSAPGKLMLMGEHAVLYGQPCLVAAISARATVTLDPRTDNHVRLSSQLGEMETTLDTLEVLEPFAFVLQAIKEVNTTKGFDLTVRCDFPADVGLGSSSAVTVATVGALMALDSGASVDRDAVFRAALSVVHAVQGTGSGADLAAATYGGVLHYATRDGVLNALPPIPLVTVYSGSKEKTAVVIEKVRRAAEAEPPLFHERFRTIGDLVECAVPAIKNGDWPMLGRLMDANQDLMKAIGVSNAKLDGIIDDLRKQPDIYGAKISGSGLGDCAIGLGAVGADFGHARIPITVDARGLNVRMD